MLSDHSFDSARGNTLSSGLPFGLRQQVLVGNVLQEITNCLLNQ
jgi:hypothetical protein